MLKLVKIAILFTFVLYPGCISQNDVSQSVDTELLDSAQNANRTMSPADRELYDKLQGAWSFVDPGEGDSLGYQFGPNGELSQTDGETLTIAAVGSYRVEQGKIIIRWGDLGGTEIATAEDFSDSSFTYKINKHTDKDQVGLSMKFVRQQP